MTVVRAFNLNFDISSYDDIDLSRFTYLLTVNLQIIYLLNTSPAYYKSTVAANLCFDGVLPLALSRLRQKHDFELVTGSECIFKLLKDEKTRNFSFLFLGAEQRINQLAVERAAREFGRDAIGFSPDFHDYISDEDQKRIKNILRSKKPEIVIVGLDTVKANRWICEHLTELKTCDVKFVSGFGGALDLLGEKLIRCPRWINKLGLEWLFRTIQQPSWYRIKRILISIAALRFFFTGSQI